MERKKISVVVSVYNEELSLNQFYKTTVSVLDKCVWDYELIFVNDGSQPKTYDITQPYFIIFLHVFLLSFNHFFILRRLHVKIVSCLVL